jgi:RNA polymerase sigma-70 factor (ECF subfamily)
MLSSADSRRETARAGTAVGVVRPLTFVGDDAALLEGLRSGHPGAPAALYDRYADYVHAMLLRIMGCDPELGDLLQEVFLQALRSVGSVRDAGRLKPWIGSVAVHVARGVIRKRSRRRWLQFRQPESLPVREAPVADEETREVLQLTFEVLERMPADERIAFSLRFVEQMELTEVAEICGTSLATAKRRIAKAEHRFVALARIRPPLRGWLERSSRWRDR